MDLAKALIDEISNPQADAHIEDLGDKDLTIIREFLNTDLYAFAVFIFGFKDLIPTLHGDLADWISNWGMVEVQGKGWVYYSQVTASDVVLRDYRRIMTQIPREHFKTSMGTIANALWQVSRTDPDGVPGIYRPIAIFNERQDNATNWLRAIRNVIQGSKEYQLIYKHLIPPGIEINTTKTLPRYWRWNDSGIDLNGKRLGEVHESISAHGIESATVGGHWPKIILDDLISLKHSMSQIEMERARTWVKNHVYLMRPAENSMTYTNCTPWTYTDIYVDLTRDFKYKLYRRSSLENKHGKPDISDGEPIFPQKLSKTKLLEMHNRDAFSFSSQMQCIPQAGAHQSFSKDWLKFGTIQADMNGEPVFVIEESDYAKTRSEAFSKKDPSQLPSPPRRIPLHRMNKVMILDPSPTEMSQKKLDSHAKTAILVEGIDCWGRRFILEAWSAYASYSEVIDKIFELSIKWSVNRVGIEEINFSNVYRHWIQREQRRDGKYPEHFLQPFPLTPKGREKHARILAREPDWKEGLYYLNKEGTFNFQVEFVEYPNSLTIDLLDCMGYDKECLSRPETEEERIELKRANSRSWPYSTPYMPTLEDYI